MYEIDKAYRTLDLEPGASLEEINQAYKDLVFIWHPDRIPKENERLVHKAQEKLKQLNEARDRLRKFKGGGKATVESRARSQASASTATTGSPSYSSGYRARRDAQARATYGPSSAYAHAAYGYRPPYTTYSNGYQSRYQNYYQRYQSAQHGGKPYGTYDTNGTSHKNDGADQGRKAASQPHNPPKTTETGQPNGAASKNGSKGQANRQSGFGSSYRNSSPESSGSANGRDRRSGSSADARPSSSSGYPYQAYNPYRARQTTPDLSNSDFRGANLKEKDFSGRNLSGSDLSGADLSDAFLHKIILNRANLHRAKLFRANLLQADLSHANLREANLIGADLSGADLSGADLSGARVGFGDKIMVKLTGTKLTGTIMPDGTIHD